jgi:hypothetical protein
MTREEIKVMAEKVYGECNWFETTFNHLEQFAKLVAEHEREVCARRLDSCGCPHCAANIRLRGKE